jgi:hypothetical protein
MDFHVNKSTVGFYFHVGKKLIDVLVLSDQSKLKIPIKKGSLEKLVLVAKNLGEDEERHGSVTFLLENYFGVEADVKLGHRYVQWITLFDHPDDDIYDGLLNEDDEEVPRVQLEFLVEEGDLTSKRSSEVASKQPVAAKDQPSKASGGGGAGLANKTAASVLSKAGVNGRNAASTSNLGRASSGRPGSNKSTE